MNLSVYALLFTLCSEVGHLFQYHVAVQKALQSLGWKYIALVPKKATALPIPENWNSILANDRWGEKKNLFFRLRMFVSNSIKLIRFFKAIKSEKNAAIFLESFELHHLASLFVSLFCVIRPAFRFLILHRYVYKNRSLKTHVYRLFHWFLEKKLGTKNVLYLTDSELLASEQKRVFKKVFSVVPIPHTETQQPALPISTGELILWWPGGSVREDKGLARIIKTIEAVQEHNRIKIVLAEKAKRFVSPCAHVEFIPTVLPRAEYVQWMRRADFILLPYLAKDYAHRTSGIFVEAISCGRFPVVTEGTWMAYELKKFGLQDLAINWETTDIVKALHLFRLNQGLAQALKRMTAHYQAYHSEKSFAEQFALLLTRS